MIAQIAQSSEARAHVWCKRIDELQAHTDPAIRALIERHYGTKDVFVGELKWRFYVTRLGPANCGYPTCLHRVVQVIDGTVQERFAFYTTGWTLWYSPIAIYAEPFRDHFGTVAVETSEDTLTVFHLPERGNVVGVSARAAGFRTSLRLTVQSENRNGRRPLWLKH